MSGSLNLAQLRVRKSSLLFSKSHFEQECPQLTRGLESALATINFMIIDQTWAAKREYYED